MKLDLFSEYDSNFQTVAVVLYTRLISSITITEMVFDICLIHLMTLLKGSVKCKPLYQYTEITFSSHANSSVQEAQLSLRDRASVLSVEIL